MTKILIGVDGFERSEDAVAFGRALALASGASVLWPAGAIAGPDPWKANTLEWFMPSPPPENNFDVIPRVRSVEPMKDIRRQVEQKTGVRQRYRDGRPTPMNYA